MRCLEGFSDSSWMIMPCSLDDVVALVFLFAENAQCVEAEKLEDV